MSQSLRVRFRVIAAEGLANVWAFLGRSLGVAAVSFALGATAIGFTLTEVNRIAESFDRQQLAGVETYSVTAFDGVGLSAALCDATRTFSGVETAGGLLGTRHVAAAQTPDSRIAVRSVTPGYFKVVFPAEPALWRSSIVAAAQLAKSLGLRPGSLLLIRSLEGGESRDEAIRVDAVATVDGRLSGMNLDMFVAVAPVGIVPECLVVTRPGQGPTLTRALHGWFPDREVRIQPIVARSQLEVDPEFDLHNRWSQWSWALAGSLLTLLAGALWWSRRSELALYRLLGFDTTSTLVMILFETTVLIIAPAQLGVAVAIAVLGSGSADLALTAALYDALRFLSLLVLAIPAGYLTSRTPRMVEALKGR